jgi:hypothetical protein
MGPFRCIGEGAGIGDGDESLHCRAPSSGCLFVLLNQRSFDDIAYYHFPCNNLNSWLHASRAKAKE